MLMVSVVIPIFNTAQYLPRCLDSVLKQNFKNLDIILVDDGSTDESGKICDQYAQSDDRFKVIHTENRGTAAARNTGLQNSEGEFIYFLDSDLYIEPGCIARLAKVMAEDKADMSICSFVVEYENNFCTNYLGYTPFGIWTPRRWVENCVKAGNNQDYLCNRMFKRKLFDDLCFPEGRCYSETAIMPQLIDRCDTITTFDRALVHNFLRENSKERTAAGAELLDMLWSIERKLEYYDENYGMHSARVKRQMVEAALKILRICAVYGSCEEFDARIGEVQNVLRTYQGTAGVCGVRLRAKVAMALKHPKLFTRVARLSKKE